MTEGIAQLIYNDEFPGSLSRPFLLLAFTFNRINRQFREHP